MEARIGREPQFYYGMASADLRTVGKRSVEWDPKNWKWDGDLFIAKQLNHNPSDYHSRQFFPQQTGITGASSNNSAYSCSDELNRGAVRENRELDRKRRVDAVGDGNLVEEGGALTLNLGDLGAAGKKTKVAGATGATPNRAICQVEDCAADLSQAKDYHRRHKVCEVHSKASRALVANQMQRFCQQCSRFHALQEFDEGKRSCRRRLAGHNKRRRKTQPDNVSNNSPINDNQANGFLLMSILKILTNMHSNGSNQADDPDLLSHLLQSLANQGSFQRNMSGRPPEFQTLLNNILSSGNSELVSALLSDGSLGPRIRQQQCTTEETRNHENVHPATSQIPGIVLPIQTSPQMYAKGLESPPERNKMNNFDLNDVYVDSDDSTGDIERSNSDKLSPPQTSGSGNSDSVSAQSPSSSSGDAQSRTDRIVFKLFGKDPSDFPLILRAQIFDWLSNSPTDIESYIRPGCVILTIYLRLSETAWEELSCDMSSSLSRLLDFSDDADFWRTGWIYTRVQNQIAFICNGQVVVDTNLPFESENHSSILSVKPIAVTISGKAEFVVKGLNLSRPSTRLLCALEGNYLESNTELVENSDGFDGQDGQSLTCSIPAVTGRGFIEVEDHGLSSSFFPFIVAEAEICAEIRMLEKEIESVETNKSHALEFINEMGWLLHKFQSQCRLDQSDPNSTPFPLKRFKYLVEFSIDRDWCAVLNKLLNILFNGIVSDGDQPFLKFALSDMGLMHRAVRRNSRSLVEMLLKYVPEKVADELSLEYESMVEIEGDDGGFLFRPDVAGPGGLTPLHVAAGRDGSEGILEALTDDPGKVGIRAWKSAIDSTGFTPEDYARLRGHYSYIHLVQRKSNKKSSSSGHVVISIPDTTDDTITNQKQTTAFEITTTRRHHHQSCGSCDRKLLAAAYGFTRPTLVYRPAMLSMVAIAAVCVCVALLFKSSPQVLYVFSPFRWEMLKYGSS